jgi:hypothetical protein
VVVIVSHLDANWLVECTGDCARVRACS